MVRITIELLRKRCEHNEGEIHSLEELALHQEKIEKIEFLDKWCRGLKILLMQNNLIPKIENVGRLKQLEYLNLALNNIQAIENLSGCESLKKLDLTLNFIGQLSSVLSLRCNRKLENLYLVGNPCCDYKGYREYVVAMLPNLKTLDGIDITKSERIKAKQIIAEVEFEITEQEETYKAKKDDEKQETGSNFGFDSEGNEEEEMANEDFWSKSSPNTIEARIALQKHLERQENEKHPKPTEKEKQPRKFETADGRVLNINEPKVSFSLHDEFTRNIIVLEINLPKHMDSSLIDATIEPNYVRIFIKGKIFQLVLPEEVITNSSFAQRSKVTGHLLITMPKLHETSPKIWTGARSSGSTELSQTKDKVIDVAATKKRINQLEQGKQSTVKNPATNKDKTVKSGLGAPKFTQTVRKTACGACDAKKFSKCVHINEADVPPLI